MWGKRLKKNFQRDNGFLFIEISVMQYNYTTIKSGSSRYFAQRKGSKFIGFAFPVNNEKELKIALESLKKEHPKSTSLLCFQNENSW